MSLRSVSGAPWLGYYIWWRVFVDCGYRMTKRRAISSRGRPWLFTARDRLSAVSRCTQLPSSVNRVYDSKAQRYAEEQNQIIRTGKYKAEVTNNKKTTLEVLYCTLQLSTDRHEASRGLSTRAEHLVIFSCIEIFAVSHANCSRNCSYNVWGRVMFVD